MYIRQEFENEKMVSRKKECSGETGNWTPLDTTS